MLEQEEITDRIIGAARTSSSSSRMRLSSSSRQIKRVIAPHCVPNFLPSLDILAET